MSIQAIARVLDLEDPRLDATSKLVLIGIANHTGINNQCFPSVRLLMRYSGMAESTVRAVITKLRDWGFIRVVYRTGKTSLYFLTLPDTPPDTGTTPPASGPTPPDPAPPTPPTSGPITFNIEPSLSASDARAMLPEDWTPDEALMIQLQTEYPRIDIDFQVKSFVLRNRSHGILVAHPDEAFKAWMHRTSELKTPPKPRAATASGPVPVGPEASAAALERDAKHEELRNPDQAAEDYIRAAMLWARLSNDERAMECATRASKLARKGSWHEDHLLAFLAAQPWGEQWIRDNDTS